VDPVNMKPASALSIVAFLFVVGFVIAAFVAGTYLAARRDSNPASARTTAIRFACGLGAWLLAFSLFVSSGLLEAHLFPLVPLTFVSLNGAAVIYALSSAGRRLAMNLPIQALVGFQAFRLPLELVLHTWAEQGTIPTAMTWTGANFDILSGITACALAPFAARRSVAWVANVIGFALLCNVGRVAIFSSPLPFAWDVQPKLLLIAHLPYALIAPVCVAGALAGHIVLTRRLLDGTIAK
jgi:hypothetical protein